MAKRILTIVLTLCMVLGTMSFSVMAADTDIIEVGTGKTYETWTAAVTAAADGNGDKAITYHIYGKVEVDKTGWVSPRGTSGATTINFVGKTADAELCISTATPTIIATDGVSDMVAINYTDLILSRPNGSWAADLAHANQFFTTWMRGAADGVVTYTNCTFLNGTCANTYNETVYTNCNFKNETSNALWIMGGDVEVVGGTVEAAKGIKTYNDNPATVINAEISDVTFDVELTPAVIASAIGEVTLEEVDTTECEYGVIENGVAGGARATVKIDGEAPEYVATATNKYGVTIYTTNTEYAETVVEAALGNHVQSEVAAVVAVVDAVPFNNFAGAVAAIANNSVVTIYEGTYEGKLDITEENVTVKAVGDVKLTGEAPSLKGTNWYVEGIDFEYPNGGNIINCSGTLKDCTFTSEQHTMRYAYGTTNGSLTIDGCTFKVGEVNKVNNWALHFDQTYGADIEIINSSFDGRFAMTGDHNSLTITGCEFTGRYANTYNDVTYTDCTFDVEYVYTGGAGVIAKFDECETADGTEIADILYNKVATVVVDGNIVTTGAKIGDDIYTSLQAAVDAANPGDVIDLGGITIDLPEVYSLKIRKDLTIQNGTIDITDGVWSGNSIIEVYGGTEADPVELTMNNVNVTGDNYSSAFGVVYAYDHGKVILNNCNFELADEAASAGGVLKGNGVAQSEFVVKDSTFMLENPNRVITNATVTIENTTIDAKVTDDTLAVGTMNNHALRSVEGTISNSTITIDGFESGVKNSGGEALVIEDNSIVELKNSVDADVNLSADAAIELKEDSKLIALNYKDDSSKDSVSSDDTSAVVDKVAYLPEAPVAEVYAGRTLADARLTGTTVYTEVYGDVLDGVWNFVDPTEVMGVAGLYQKEIIFTPADATYDEIDIMIDVTVRELASRPSTSVGGTGGSTTPAKITVKFETNGGSEIEDVKVEKGEAVEAPEAPEKENNIFAGWFADKELTKEFDFGTEIKKATTIYAGWVEITAENSIVLVIGEKAAAVFGEDVENDVAPLIVNDRTMLPARFVAESLGANVEWDEENQKVTITKDEIVIEIFIGKDYATVNGEEVELDSAAFIENSRTYTPVRFISEELGAHVDWDDETKTVTIVKVK